MPHIAFANRRGLPDVFNERIHAAAGHDHLVFVHDDVWLDDFFLAEPVMEGLASFDVIGVAGNRRRVPRQPAWAFVGKNADGPVCLGRQTLSQRCHRSWREAIRRHFLVWRRQAECELLDGVFLAARRSTLRSKGVRFDPSFDFHFYDLDFCRSARAAGLRLGTWPIAMTHQSGGAFGSGAVECSVHQKYLEKWGSDRSLRHFKSFPAVLTFHHENKPAYSAQLLWQCQPALLDVVNPGARGFCEFGCGSGALARAIRQRCPGVHYVGVELMAEQLALAQEVLDVALVRNLDAIPDWTTDAELSSALPAGSFDHVIFGDVLEHLYDPPAVLQQAARRLSAGGQRAGVPTQRTALGCICSIGARHLAARRLRTVRPYPHSLVCAGGHGGAVAGRRFGGRTSHFAIASESSRSRGEQVTECLKPLPDALGVDHAMFTQHSLPLQYVLVGRKLDEGPYELHLKTARSWETSLQVLQSLRGIGRSGRLLLWPSCDR